MAIKAVLEQEPEPAELVRICVESGLSWCDG